MLGEGAWDFKEGAQVGLTEKVALTRTCRGSEGAMGTSGKECSGHSTQPWPLEAGG